MFHLFFPSGYAVGAGHFLDPQSIEIVGGAPQHEQTGKVRVNITTTTIIIYTYLIISTDPSFWSSLVLKFSSLVRHAGFCTLLKPHTEYQRFQVAVYKMVLDMKHSWHLLCEAVVNGKSVKHFFHLCGRGSMFFFKMCWVWSVYEFCLVSNDFTKETETGKGVIRDLPCIFVIKLYRNVTFASIYNPLLCCCCYSSHFPYSCVFFYSRPTYSGLRATLWKLLM